MIPIAIILGTVIIGSSLLKKYWRKIVDFLKTVITKLKTTVHGMLMGSKVFIKKIGDKYQNRTKNYSKDELGKWKETIVSYEQVAYEIPEEYREKAGLEEEYDLTEELELELSV